MEQDETDALLNVLDKISDTLSGIESQLELSNETQKKIVDSLQEIDVGISNLT